MTMLSKKGLTWQVLGQFPHDGVAVHRQNQSADRSRQAGSDADLWHYLKAPYLDNLRVPTRIGFRLITGTEMWPSG